MDNSSGAKNEEKGDVVVTEIPAALDKLLLLMVKNFYSKEQFLLVYYIMRAVCIKEEHLRARVQFEHKQMRAWIAQLKGDKIIRERLISQKNANNRNVTMIFYFINYRALLNILAYKIDHMRQRLEAREKDSVQKSHYKCGRCEAQYEDMDMDRIFDPMTMALTCWRCQGEVKQDESSGPTSETRSLLAKFNEQLVPMFTVIRELKGIQLAPHLYEPDINKYLDDPNATDGQQQLVDFSGKDQGDGAPVQLGGVAFKQDAGNRSSMLNKETIIVDLNAGSNIVVEEQKAVPTWLTESAIGGDANIPSGAVVGIDTLEEEPEPAAKRAAVDLSMLTELEGLDEPSTTEEKTDITSDQGTMEEAQEEEDGLMSDDDEPMVMCEGKEYPLSEIIPEMVERMSEEERAQYVQAVQENMDY